MIIMKVLSLLLLLHTAFSLHLRSETIQAEYELAEPASSGPAPTASEEVASSGPASGDNNNKSGSKFANMLLKLADQMDGKGGASGPEASKHQNFVKAVLKSAEVLGTHHATKVTLEQVVEAMQKMKKKEPKKLPIKEIVNALRIPPLKPPKKKPDLKKLLGTAVDAVESKLNQLEAVLNQKGSDEEENETANVVEKSVEELNASDLMTGLNKIPPEKLPKPMLIIKPKPGAPIP
jgi:hypothetical protein